MDVKNPKVRKLGAKSKRAAIIRKASEFDIARLSAQLKEPKDSRGNINAWSLAQIFSAREAQLRGDFHQPARMAEQMRTDDALYVAYENRLAPQRCIPVEMVPAKGARGASIASEAEALFGQSGVGIHPDTKADIHGCLVNHGVAFATITANPRDDGSRIDFELHYWPIEYVQWHPYYKIFLARTDILDVPTGDISNDPTLAPQVTYQVPIVHGDGRWVVFTKHEDLPFRQEAALLAAAIVWARHAYACRDWTKGSVAHGSAKFIGELPEGLPIQQDGSLTPEASALLELLRTLLSSDSPVGIRPPGSKTEFVTNNSNAWQVFSELVKNAEKAAARIYLGTDGTLGSTGGAPGVDITALFGVASTKVRGDLECLERGINTGVIEPWCAINFGDSSNAPKLRYVLPNEEQSSERDDYAKRNTAFFLDLKSARDAGLEITQEWVDALATKYGVETLALKTAPAATDAPADGSNLTESIPAAPPVSGDVNSDGSGS
jgi:hypothetical protein